MTTSLTLLRSTSGAKEEISFPLSQTLKTLKKAVAGSDEIGRIPVKRQRVFYMGRELRGNGRSLESLGVGRFGVFTVHVHAVPRGPDGGENSDDDAVEVVTVRAGTVVSAASRSSGGSAAARRNVTIDLLDDDSDDDDCVVLDSKPAAASGPRRRKRQRVA